MSLRFQFDRQLSRYFAIMERKWAMQALNLGGVTGSGGGTGNRPGGFVGKLPQTKVTYDLSEIASSGTPASGESLLDNLNHIRYRIEEVEDGSGTNIHIYDSGVLVASGISIIDFDENLDVTYSAPNKVIVSGGGGTGSGISGIEIQEDDIEISDEVTIINFEGDVDVVDDGAGKVTVTVSGTAGSGAGAETFLELTDTPSSYTTYSGKPVVVKTTGDGLEFNATNFSEEGHTHVENDITDLTHTDTNAIHDNVANEISALSEKVTIVDADLIIIEDSENSYNKKKVQINNLPTGSGIGGITIQEDDIEIASDVTIINFEGNTDVVNEGSNKVTVTVSGAYSLVNHTWNEDVTLSGIIPSGTPLSTSGEFIDGTLRFYYNGLRQGEEFFEEGVDNATFIVDFDIDTDDEVLVDYDTQSSATGSNGWTGADETWTYASADDPTFTFTIVGDKTDKYSAGMRIKLKQTTNKYFIVTKVAYGAPNTTITIYGGTDYDLANATITEPFFSTHKAPVGFPLSPDKWTVEVTDSSNRNQATPTQNVWYNVGTITISIPLGVWNTHYSAQIQVADAVAGGWTIYSTLSTANNSESDSQLTAYGYGTDLESHVNSVYKAKVLNLASKTSYYLNIKTANTGADTIYVRGDGSPTIIRAICAYL